MGKTGMNGPAVDANLATLKTQSAALTQHGADLLKATQALNGLWTGLSHDEFEGQTMPKLQKDLTTSNQDLQNMIDFVMKIRQEYVQLDLQSQKALRIN